MLSWFGFCRCNEARCDRFVDAAVEVRHHGAGTSYRPFRRWAPTALAAVALAGVGGIAGHTLASPSTMSMVSASQSSSIDGASTSVPGQMDDPVRCAGDDAPGGVGSGVGDEADADAAGAGSSSSPATAPDGSSAGAGAGGTEEPGGSGAGAGEPTVIGPIIAGDIAIGPITVTRGPEGPEVVGDVSVEEGNGGGAGSSSTLTATPAPTGSGTPGDAPGFTGDATCGGSSPRTSGANPGTVAGSGVGGEGSSSTSGARPSKVDGDASGDAGGEGGAGSGSAPGSGQPGASCDGEGGGGRQDREGAEKCQTAEPDGGTSDESAPSSSARVPDVSTSARMSGTGGAWSTTSAAPQGLTATQETGIAGALGSTTGALLGGVLPVAGMRLRRRRMGW